MLKIVANFKLNCVGCPTKKVWKVWKVKEE